MSYQYQQAELVEEWEVWLKAIYKNPTATEKELLIPAYKRLGYDFDPQEMPHILFSAPQVPSLLALTHTDPENPMIKLSDDIFKQIKEKLYDNPSLQEITSEDLARWLNCFEDDVQIALGHIGKLPGTFGSAGGRAGGEFGYNVFGFGDNIRSYSAYFKHDSIYDLIEESYQFFMQHSKDSATNDVPMNASAPARLPTEEVVYIDPARIEELKAVKSEGLDLSKLIRLCEEVNAAYSSSSYYSVVMLLRAIIDHVPPIFGKDNFSQVASEITGRTKQRAFTRLDESLKDLANINLHHQIRKKESPPNKTVINFSSELDTLLVEIIHELH